MSRRHGQFQPRNSATMNAEESSKIFWHLSCAQEQSLPSLDIQTKQTLSKILKALTSSSSVIIERSNLSSCKPILNYCDVGLTIVIIAFGKTKKLVRSSCDPSDLKSRSFAISFTKPWQGGNGRGRAMQRMDISLEYFTSCHKKQGESCCKKGWNNMLASSTIQLSQQHVQPRIVESPWRLCRGCQCHS